ncbi:outer membrane protein assembly factor BamD [Dysgonomonas sp. 216]|uniref:outer membrane protein assembly factor BamD n=1 Tax=Dysgonomonas sp. 216 TaxID=2302934 RepID=UPI0013D30B6D|nr:outer membrane protein assembly factor BamD [Dysgonomonas sp. 216]NDW17381.1 outer membrane protein assembly factor BamD [Dysgonomonas sp. 216]
MKKILYIFIFSLLLASCGEYNKILKSSDYELKYTYAKKYYEEKRYGRTITLLEELVPIFKGTSKAEESLFLLAQAFYYDKNYETATQYYKTYYTTYPKGEYTENARFSAAYSMFLDSPDPRLDQSSTYKAIQEFQNFLEYYPQSDKVQLAQEYMFELQDKLAYKDYMAARLYYNLGNYMGNNYEACVITARESLRVYPFSKLAEEFQILVVRSRYELAANSIDARKSVRFRDVIDEYYNYLNMFPEGKYKDEVTKYYKASLQELGEQIELGTGADASSSKE